MDAKTREDVPVVGEGDDIGRRRLPFKIISLAVRGFAKGYLMEFVIQHSGKHL